MEEEKHTNLVLEYVMWLRNICIFVIEIVLHVSVLDNLITFYLCVQNNQIYICSKNRFAF